MKQDGHDAKPGERPPLATSKTWPEVPSAIGRSEGLAAHAQDSGSFVSPGATGHSGLHARPPRASYRAPDRNFEALCARASGLAESGRLDDALRIALVCIEEEPLHHAGFLAAARIQEQRGRLAEAEVLIERALLIVPDLAEAETLRARVQSARRAGGSLEPRGPRVPRLSA